MTERVLIFVCGIVVGILIALMVSEDAEASQVPEERVTDFVGAAQAYWGRMLPGRTPTGPVVVRFGDGAALAKAGCGESDSACGTVRGHDILLKTSYWQSYSAENPTDVQALCVTVVHEYGHNIGLGHTPNYPIMRFGGPTPVECGGDDASPNPHLALTEFLYSRKRRMVDAIARNRSAGHCRGKQHRCRPLKKRLARVLEDIAELEGTYGVDV